MTTPKIDPDTGETGGGYVGVGTDPIGNASVNIGGGSIPSVRGGVSAPKAVTIANGKITSGKTNPLVQTVNTYKGNLTAKANARSMVPVSTPKLGRSDYFKIGNELAKALGQEVNSKVRWAYSKGGPVRAALTGAGYQMANNWANSKLFRDTGRGD